MSDARNPAEFDARIETLIGALESSPDEQAQRHARELVQLVLAFHRRGLTRILDIVRHTGADAVRRVVGDPVVASVLALHDLAPVPVRDQATDVAPLQLIRPGAAPAGPLPQIAGDHHMNLAGGCERCGASLSETHRHAVDLDTRRLSCLCRACSLILQSSQEGRSSRVVPDRYVHGPDLHLTDGQWDALQIPVDLAFLMFNTAIGRTIAFYPGPAGATESALPLAAWGELVAANPWVRSAAPDVEALFVRRSVAPDTGYACLIVPIDACYELAGRIRVQWTGFDGGVAVRTEIERFVSGAIERAAHIGSSHGN